MPPSTHHHQNCNIWNYRENRIVQVTGVIKPCAGKIIIIIIPSRRRETTFMQNLNTAQSRLRAAVWYRYIFKIIIRRQLQPQLCHNLSARPFISYYYLPDPSYAMSGELFRFEKWNDSIEHRHRFVQRHTEFPVSSSGILRVRITVFV